MADLTVTDAQTHLDAWLAADLAVAKGQSYAIGSRSLTRADASTIAERITYWRGELQRLTAIAAGNTGGGVLTARWS